MKKLLAPLTLFSLVVIGTFLPTSSTATNTTVTQTSPARSVPQDPRPGSGKTTAPQRVRTNATIEAFDSLIAKARSDGPVRVIVGLRLDDFEPEGRLTNPNAVIAQREAIARVQSAVVDRLAAFEAKVNRRFSFIPYAVLTVDAASLEQLKLSDDVISVEEDVAVYPDLVTSVPLIGAPTAWAAGHSGSGQAVAILDTGVDKNHSFLSGKVVSEACFSSNTSISSSVCPGGVSSSTSSGSGLNCATFIEGCNHGTHVAGIAAGKGASFSGVARDANIIAIQVFSRFDSTVDCKGASPCVRTFNSDQIAGLERVFALRNTFNISAANMSLGGGRFFSNCDTQSQKAAIDNLRSVGIATVIAAGNESFKDSLGAPACISSAISVGATGDGSGGGVPLDAVAGFSNSASFLSLLAPGTLINSSVPGGGFANFQGTSMAAPHVAGAWAVLKSKKPTATVTEVLDALRDTGLPVTDVNGITKARIKVDAAINAIGGSGTCTTTPIALGQSRSGTLVSTDCRYPVGSDFFSDPYSLNGVAGQQVSITMTSTAFDAWVALIGPNGVEIAFNNDGGGGTDSRIPAGSGFFTLPSTGTYTIQASTNFTNASGSYSVSLNGPPTGVGNDNFANAQLISGSSGVATGNNTGATKEPLEPDHAVPGGASVWYRWQAPSTGTMRFTTSGSNFDTLLAVYTGSSVGALTPIASNDDASSSTLTSQVTFNAVAGTTYRIAVDGFFGSTGSIVLNWVAVVPIGPANNDFANAQLISGSSGAVTGTNVNANKESGEPDHAGDNGGVSIWYRWQAPSSGTATITTTGSNFDTLLGVYTGTTVGGLNLIASNDDENFPIALSSRVVFTAVAGTTYRIAVDGFAGSSGNVTLNFNTQNANTIQFSSSTFSVLENGAVATVIVTRSGSVASAATVNFATTDIAGLQSCTLANGRGSERCDYVTSVGTVRFAAGESAKTITIPIIDDVLLEGSETFTIALSSPSGGSLGSPGNTTVVIFENDFLTPLSNPIDGVEFFIRQQYLDILNRQPDSTGLQNWINTLAPCPNGGFGEPPTSNCDRLHVAAGFFQSDEFLNRGYWAFKFYMVSRNQRPTYAQFIPDMAQVGGPKSPAEEQTSKAAFANAFVQRPDFLSRYGGLTGQPLANALLTTAGLPGNTFTVTPGMSNGQILRGIVETTAATNRFLTEGTVAIQYFGFLRRDPDTVGFQNNVNTLNANPNNLRHMIFIFIYSTEYRGRFGPP
ncbi:MAG TPA: S8 family serine peptidase [Pyrinomonadaceae bacterium]|nr:S8 family serine peptidase [Pyrinomonadaceae bacterium]